MGEERKRPLIPPTAAEPAAPDAAHQPEDAVARISRVQLRMESARLRNEVARDRLVRVSQVVQSALSRGGALADATDQPSGSGWRGARAGRSPGRGVADPLELVLEQSCLLASATAALVYELSASEEVLELVCATGLPLDGLDAWRHLPVSPDLPAGEAVRLRTAVSASSWEELCRRYPALSAAILPPHLGASITLPLTIDGLCNGVLVLLLGQEGAFTGDDLDLLRPIAMRIARCLESVALVKRDRQSRARLYLLAEASRVFSAAGPEVSSVLGAIANQILVSFASSCSITLLSEDGAWLDVALIRDRDPDNERCLREMTRNVRIAAGQGLTGRVLATGRSVFLPAIRPGDIADRTTPSM